MNKSKPKVCPACGEPKKPIVRPIGPDHFERERDKMTEHYHQGVLTAKEHATKYALLIARYKANE